LLFILLKKPKPAAPDKNRTKRPDDRKSLAG